MNKLGTSLLLVGMTCTLALTGCASKDAPAEELGSAASAELSRASEGDAQVMTDEQFIQSGGQPLTSGGDTPGDGTTLYTCPTLVLTPSVSMPRASEYMSFNSGQPNYMMSQVEDVYVGRTRSQFTFSKKVGPWFSVNEFVCGVGIVAKGGGLAGTASVNYKKSFAPEKLCQFYGAPGDVHFNAVLCKDAPSPI